MRTITKTLRNRLIAQSEEASFQGFDKIASSINDQLDTIEVRADDDDYMYSHIDLSNDVENLLWSAAVRIQDYYEKTADAALIQNIIDEAVEELISSIKTKIGGDIIGPYEPTVPGEERLIVEMD